MRPRFIFALAAAALCLTSAADAQFRYPYPYPYYRYAEPESDLRIAVKPSEASVYVDGYFAGRVEEFDGKLQRLHVVPGQHEITIYLEGYRPLTQKLYLSPRGNRKIEGALEKLAPGEVPPPPPEPIEPPPPPPSPPPGPGQRRGRPAPPQPSPPPQQP